MQEISTGARRVINYFARRASPDTIANRPDVIEILKDAVFLYACYRFKSLKKSSELAKRYRDDYTATLEDAEAAMLANPGQRSVRRMTRTQNDEEVPYLFSQSYGLGRFLQ